MKGIGVLLFLIPLSLGSLHVALSDRAKETSGSFVGVVYETKSNYFLFASGSSRYYVYEANNSREAGDILEIKGKSVSYEATSYESRFDFKEYLKKKGISKQLYLYKVEEKLRMPIRLVEKENSFLSSFSSEAGNLISSLLFDRRDSSSEIFQKASSLGALYFLSSSGLLFSLLLSSLEKFFSLGLKERSSKALVFIVGCFSIAFTPLKVGAWRVLLFRFFSLLFKKENRPPSYFLHAVSGLLLLFTNPFLALSSSFLVGFSLSLFNDFSSPSLSSLSKKKKKENSRFSFISFIFPIYCSGNRFHFFSFFYSFILLPFIVPFSLIALLSFLSIPYVTVLNGYASFLSSFLSFLSKIDLSLPIGGDYGPFLILLYYPLIPLVVYLWDIGFRNAKKVFALGAISFLLVNSVPIPNLISSSVSFINVGQGDAILIQKGLTNVLIDTGGSTYFDLGREVDLPYLSSKRIYTIDCLIESHGDFDHIGAESSLCSNMNVKRIVKDSSEFPLNVGGLQFNNYNVYPSSESNESSLVISLDFMGIKWLFTGDAPMALEKKIVKDNPDLRCDVLKVGHHGSDTSSSLEFLQCVKPTLGIISVGKKNQYGHPSEEVIKRFASLGIPLRYTSEEGTISFSSFFGSSIHL